MGFDEKSLVEDYIMQKLQKKGWKFIPAEELERDSYQEPLLIPNLIRALERINKALDIEDEEINKVLNELKLAGTGIEGVKRILNLYKLGVPVKFEKDKVVRYILLFDFENIENNEFIVTRQVNYDGRERIRTDVILYVNGIPLVNIECKNPASISESWYNAYSQIKKVYEKTVPELYKYIQMGIAAESQAKYFPIVPWQGDVRIHGWQSEDKDSIDSTIEMLSRDTLLDILKHFLFIREEHGNATKVITRYMQYRAANKMVNRVNENLTARLGNVPYSGDSSPNSPKNKGLIWHWQGSGKTLTMLFAANKLYYTKELENPTIFFVVDRIDLEDQLYDEFYSMDIVQPEIIYSIDKLKEVLAYDDYRGKRGIFIVLVHKFRPEELKNLQKEIAFISESKETIMNRKNIVAFIDEAQRTQYGTMAGQMKAILKSAFFFALTGTPIAKKGRDTYENFGYPPEELYLDKYFITDSIRDGFTVKIVYQPRLEKEHMKKDWLKEFLEMELEELPEDIREDVEEKVKKRLKIIRLFLENPKRIEAVARDIAEHFKENVDDKFKAMVVASSRIACTLYKNELDKHLPREYSEIVMTDERDDAPAILKYVAETKPLYKFKGMSDIRKEVRENFKEKDLPKILIVTDMLLTGFDAPILQTMYLDKPLKEHRLLQAIARTNRPFGDFKEAGLVIDYVGILKEFKKAFEKYSETDITSALFNYDSLREDFVKLTKEIFELFKDVPVDYQRETLLKAIEILTADEEKEKEFTEKYRNLRKIFELLGPDEIKLEYFEDYKWLSAIYAYYMKLVIQKPDYESYAQKFLEKTIQFVHRATEVEKIEKELPVITIDEDYLKKLDQKIKDKKEKAANILFTLNRLVLVERHRSPIYESLVEKVERLLEIWKEKTKDYEKIYSEGAKILTDFDALLERQKALSFSDLEYSILLVLENKFGKTDQFIDEVKNLSEIVKEQIFDGWMHQATVSKEVEKEARRFTRRLKSEYNLSLPEMNDLFEKLIESIRNYGT